MSAQSHLEDLLDEGIEESFPASDPVSVSVLRAKENQVSPAAKASRLALGLGAFAVAAVGAGVAAYAVHVQREHERERRRRTLLLLAASPLIGLALTGAVLWLRPRPSSE